MLPVLMLHLQDQLKSECDSLHGTVDVEYVHMKYTGAWTLLKGHGDIAALTGTMPLPKAVLQAGVCWNCGKEGHCLNDCKKPHDSKCIDVNKRLFSSYDAKTRKKGTKEQGRQHGNWAPGSSWSRESDHKVINSIPYPLKTQTKHWDVVSTTCDPIFLATPPPPTQNSPMDKKLLVNWMMP
jgi:hypothetical protein